MLRELRVLPGLHGAFSVMTVSMNVCETPVNTPVFVGLYLTTLWHFPLQSYQQFSVRFLTRYLPSRSFFFFLFGFPFLPCSMYLHCSSLLVGLVFPTFSLYGTRRGGRRERNVRQWSRVERKWRGDGCKTGWETEEEREPRRSPSRETGSSSSKLNLPSQRGLARRYLTYYFTWAYLKSLLRDEIQNLKKKKKSAVSSPRMIFACSQNLPLKADRILINTRTPPF